MGRTLTFRADTQRPNDLLVTFTAPAGGHSQVFMQPIFDPAQQGHLGVPIRLRLQPANGEARENEQASHNLWTTFLQRNRGGVRRTAYGSHAWRGLKPTVAVLQAHQTQRLSASFRSRRDRGLLDSTRYELNAEALVTSTLERSL